MFLSVLWLFRCIFILKGLPCSCTQASSKHHSEKKAAFFWCPRGGREEAVQAVNTICSWIYLLVWLHLPAQPWYRVIFILCWESLSKLSFRNLSVAITPVVGQCHLLTGGYCPALQTLVPIFRKCKSYANSVSSLVLLFRGAGAVVLAGKRGWWRIVSSLLVVTKATGWILVETE